MVLPRERMLFSKAGLPGMYRAVLRFGYQDRMDLGPEFVAALVHEVRPPARCLILGVQRTHALLPAPSQTASSQTALTRSPTLSALSVHCSVEE